MTKNAFFKVLDAQIRKLPPEEREEIFEDYQEHFRAAAERGLSEEDTVRELGDPKALGKAHVLECAIHNFERAEGASHKSTALLRMAFTFIGLSLFNVLVMWWVGLALVIGLFVLWVVNAVLYMTGGGLVLGGFLGAMGALPFLAEYLPQQSDIWTCLSVLFAGIGIICLGGLYTMGLGFLTRWLGKGLSLYAKANTKLLSRSSEPGDHNTNDKRTSLGGPMETNESCETATTTSAPVSDKSLALAAILAFFFGTFGAHRFYVGKITSAVFQLLTLGGLGLWSFIDFLIILFGEFRDRSGAKIAYAQKGTS